MRPRISQLILLLFEAAEETFSMFSALREVCGGPEHLLPSTLSLPFLKRRCHSKACVRNNVSQPYTYFKISHHIWKREIVNPDDPDRDYGTELLNYGTVIGPCRCAKIRMHLTF
ncbi:hypothetical protein TNCV_4562441 [Trichonephila clavipes]|nr:hypothetical protein TNCV_4562441 [Trichonephila clavipes]